MTGWAVLILWAVATGTLVSALCRAAARGDQPNPEEDTVATPHEGTPLSAREVESLAGIAAGLTVDEIASGLFIAPTTVRSYLGSALAKLGVHTRAAAVWSATALGVLTAEHVDAARAR